MAEVTRRVLLSGALVLAGCGGGAGVPGLPGGPTVFPGPAAPANIAGNYTLNLVASPVCTNLSAAYRNRTYGATITQNGDTFAVNLTGGNLILQITNGTVSGNRVSLLFSIAEFDGYVAIVGGEGEVRATAISGPGNGVIGPLENPCDGVDHRFTFTRR